MISPSASLVLGTFEAERMWTDASVATLPAVAVGRDSLVGAMDETLMCLCGPDDVLVTRSPLNAAYRDYLRAICGGPARFISLEAAQQERPAGDPLEPTASLLLDACERDPAILDGLSAAARLRPYAIHDGTNELAERLKLPERPADVGAVVKVNSKRFARETLATLWPDRYPGFHTQDMSELTRRSRELLDGGEVVFKEDFGVSGKGNLRIGTSKRLARVLLHLQQQLDAGKRLSLTVEPFLDKRVDFSCHFDLTPNGGVELHGVQVMLNQNFGHVGSAPASDALLALLSTNDYLAMIERVAELIRDQGYAGPVCVDSMLLQDSTVIPVVEVNARYSMGRICHELVGRVGGGRHFRLVAMNLTHPTPLSFEGILQVLDRREMLLRGPNESGVCPLSANTLNTRRLDSGPAASGRGRIYALLAARDRDTLDALHADLAEVLREAGARVTNLIAWPQDPLA